jgi:N6-adenosine-specific RNA methylase IME4
MGDSLSMLDSTKNQISLILADPPWRQTKGGKKAARPKSSGGNLDYQTLSLDDIKIHLEEFNKLTTDNSVLFLWTIDKYLFEAQKIAEDLGYKLHARMIWNKVTGIPAAFTIRYGHEYLLYMYKGKLIPVAKDMRGKIHSVFTEQVTKHSKKPEISFKIIEELYPELVKIELYAREKRDGWLSWGDQIKSDLSLDIEVK